MLVAYLDETGDAITLTGDGDAPYVHALGRTADASNNSDVVSQAGAPQRILLDTHGRIILSSGTVIDAQAAPILYSRSTALENTRVVKASAGELHEIRMLTTTGISAPRWLMVFDAAAAPVNGASPIWRALLPNQAAVEGEVADSFEAPLTMTVGISLAISTTQLTLTLPGAAEALFSAGYT